MIVYNYKQQVQPHGGHHFTDLDGYKMEADTYDELVQKIKDHRLNNNKLIGEPDVDVCTFYENHFPWCVCEGNSHPSRSWDLEEDDPEVTIHRWVKNIWRIPPKKLVDDKEFKARMECCAKCPFNKPFNASHEQGIETMRRGLLLSKLPDITPKGLGYCEKFKWLNVTACHIHSPPEDIESLKKICPENCWLDSKKPN